MNFHQFLLILKARKYIFLVTLAVTVTATLVVSSMLPKTYKATTSLVLNYKGSDPLTGMMIPTQLMPGYMATQMEVIKSQNVALRVVDGLKMAEGPSVQQQFEAATGGRGTPREWLATALLSRLDVTPSRASSVLEVTFAGADPQFAATMANAFAEEYQKLNVQLKNDPMKKASAYLNEQTRLLRDTLEAAQARLSKYQQDHGIVSVDNRIDVESNRLNELSAQLVMAQSQLADAQSRRTMANGASYTESPDVTQNPMIQSLKVNVANGESKLAEAAQRYGRNHPLYLALAAEVARMRSELGAQMRITSNSVSNNATLLGGRAAAIEAALAEQKKKVLALNRTRDEMNVLVKDVESAQRAYEAASSRFSQTRIEGMAEQSDVAVLNPAVAPLNPSGPKVMLNTALAAFLGTILGLAFSLVAEMIDRRLRSTRDLSDVLQIPVLGTIDWSAPSRPRLNRLSMIMPRLRLN